MIKVGSQRAIAMVHAGNGKGLNQDGVSKILGKEGLLGP